MELVSSVGQVIDNIKRYNEHAAGFAELMPYNRSWYAFSTGTDWLLGPSKYIGYPKKGILNTKGCIRL